MGLFSKLFKKTSTDVRFEKAEPQKVIKLENQNGVIENCSCPDMEEFIEMMLEDPDQFITLSLPSARYGIRFVQACRVDDGIDVELGIEEDNHTKLICKTCSEEECWKVFYELFDTANVCDRRGYEPIQIQNIVLLKSKHNTL